MTQTPPPRQIVVGVDGSASSVTAVYWAREDERRAAAQALLERSAGAGTWATADGRRLALPPLAPVSLG